MQDALTVKRYIGKSLNPYKYFFFLLLRDVMETETTFYRNLKIYFERFARNLDSEGLFISPNPDDISTTKSEVHEKPWPEGTRKELQQTPALLIIKENFDGFNPEKHPWIIFSFKNFKDFNEVEKILDELTDAVSNSDKDIFEVAKNLRMKDEAKLKKLATIFDFKLGLFGLSIDLVKALEFLKTIRQNA